MNLSGFESINDFQIFFFRFPVVLDAPDTVLLERQAGKRVDPETGDVYHTTFDWPQDPSIQERLVEPAGISQDETKVELVRFFTFSTSLF